MKLFITAALVVAALGACSSPDDSPLNSNPSANASTTDTGVDDGTSNEDVQDSEPTVARIEIDPATLQLERGQTAELSAAVLDDDGEPVDGVAITWRSSAPDVAEVTDIGVVIGHELGQATITASADGVEGTAEVIITGPPVARVEVTPQNRTMLIGDSVTIVVSLYDAFNAPIDEMEDPRDVSFVSSDEQVVSVDDTATVTAVGGGSATVTTTVEGIEATSQFHVMGEDPLDRVEVTPSTVQLARGATAQLTATAFVGNTEEPDVTFDWSSDDDAIATVDTDGLVTAVAKGTTTVTATAAGLSDSVDVTVTFAFDAIAAGGAHACGLVDGVAYCWGSDSESQLGHQLGPAPAPVDTDLRFEAIAAGSAHTCAIDTAGKGHCWGRGDEGQRGDGSMATTGIPAEVAGNHTFNAVAATGNGTCAVEGSTLCCWGQYGEQTSVSPVVLGGYVAPAIGGSHVCGIDGDLGHCRGSNADGQLGINVFGGTYPSWEAILGGFQFDLLAAGADHSCGVTPGGATLCWGDNTFGQVGDATNMPRKVPILLSTPASLSRVTAGLNHNCALSGAGVPYCWGDNSEGQLGTGAVGGSENAPVAANTTVRFNTIAAGEDFTCAISLDGDPYCWGNGQAGQLGPGGSQPSPSPVTGF